MRILYYLAQVTIDQDRLQIPGTELTGNTSVKNALQIVFGIAGSIAFIIVVLAGLRYTLSQGEPQAAAKAKNQIVYALIGLTVCLLAFSMVTYVMERVG